jgi:hypothetical protein
MFSYRLDLARINLHNSNPRGDKLLSQCIREASDRSLRSAVDATTRIRLSSCNTSNVDDVSSATCISLFENGKDCLGHVDQSGDVGREHSIYVFRGDIRSLGNALDQATVLVSMARNSIVGAWVISRIIDEHIDIVELSRQRRHKVPDLIWVTNVQFHC